MPDPQALRPAPYGKIRGMVMGSLLRVEADDGVAEIVLDHPPVNQFSEEFVRRLLEAVRGLPAETRALVVSSGVDRIFAAGGDIPYMAAATHEAQVAYVGFCQEANRALEELPCPVIAAIDGACLGGGLELALACDIRIVGASAVLGLPEVTIGLIAGGGAIHRLARAVGQTWARDLLLTGRRLSGAEAVAAGLASRLVDDGEAGAVARALARSLANGAREAIEVTKHLVIHAPDDEFGDGLALERAAWSRVRLAPTSQEGLDAFTEKRPPDFRRAGR